MSDPKKKILIFCDYYLPGIKSGGGLWTIVNLVEHFGDRYDFSIVTRNHDGKTDMTPFANVVTGKWNNVGAARVLYLSPSDLTMKKAAAVVKEVGPNALILNSTLNKSALAVLHARRLGLIEGVPLILFATGELTKPALATKSVKKRAFLRYARLAALHRDIIWKASSELERDEVREAISRNAEIWIAPDLPPKCLIPDFDPAIKPEKKPGKARFVFAARVTPHKNLYFFLDLLKDVTGSIELEIIGPPEPEYWKKCQQVVADLPTNVKVEMTGAQPHSVVLERLCASHFFALPTLSENFGYSIVEAMAAGCPMLISNRTIWTDIRQRGIGWTLPLENASEWKEAIEECVSMTQEKYTSMSDAARQYAITWLADPTIEQATQRVIERALNGPGRDDE